MSIDRHTRDLAILNAVAKAPDRSVDLDSALRAALSRATGLLELHAGWNRLLNPEDGEHYLAAAQNLPPGLAREPRKMEGWCHCVEQYLEGELDTPANIDVIICTRLQGMLAGADGLRYHASVPLHAHYKQIGILNVASADWCELSSDDLRLLYTICDMLSIAVERAWLHAQSTQLASLRARGVGIAGITLHTGVSSQEVETAQLEEHPMTPEPFSVPARTAEAVNRAKRSGRRVITVGTTVVRALESAWADGQVQPMQGFTRLFVHPERGVRVVDGLLSGLHDPLASHLAMLYAVAGRERVQAAYARQ